MTKKQSNKPVNPADNRHGPGTRYQMLTEQKIRASTPPSLRGLLAKR